MNDTGFRTHASKLGARAFAATLIFVAPAAAIVAMVVVGLNDAWWKYFANQVETNIFVPYAWALASAALVFCLGAVVGYPTMLIVRWRDKREAELRDLD